MALNVNIIGRDSEGNLRALKVNSEGNLKVQLSGTNAYLYTLSSSVEVPAGTNVNMDVVVPANEIWTVKTLDTSFPPPNGSSSGNHLLLVSIGASHMLMRIQQSHDKRLNYQFNTVVTDSALTEFTTGVLPSSRDALANILKDVVIDSSITLRFSYYNNTDVAQTGNRMVRMLVERRSK